MYQFFSRELQRLQKLIAGPHFFRMLPWPSSPPILVLNVVFWQASPKPKLYTKFEVAIFNGCRNKYEVPKFSGYSPGPDPRQFWSLTLFFGKLVPNPICAPNLKLLVSTVAKIRRGSQFFSDAPLAQTPANFGTKHRFLVS